MRVRATNGNGRSGSAVGRRRQDGKSIAVMATITLEIMKNKVPREVSDEEGAAPDGTECAAPL